MGRRRPSDLGLFQILDSGQVIDDAPLIIRFVDVHGRPKSARGLREYIVELREDLETLRLEDDHKRRKINRLLADADAADSAHQRYDDAVEVLRFWKEHCHPNATQLVRGERIKKVLARLSGEDAYTVDELKESVLGYKAFPYVVNARRVPYGQPAQRYVDAELIFRTPKHVDQGRAFYEQSKLFERGFEQPTLTAVQASQQPLRAPESPPKPLASPLGRAAASYAQRGWYVFPCVPNAKQPATINGLLDAKPDVQAVTQYWSKRPTANVAIRTGVESGLIVLDVDGEEGFASLRQLESRIGKLPRTASVVTPRGGQHFYFRHPERTVRNSVGLLGPGLDIRGDGGYVLAPPSQVNGKRYEVEETPKEVGFAHLPAQLLDHLLAQQAKAKVRVDPSTWENMIGYGIKEGSRNAALTKLTGYFLSRGIDEGVVLGLLKLINAQRCSPPLPDREVETILNHILTARRRSAA